MAGFNEIIRSGKPVLVDFFAEWCGPCKVLAPTLKLAKDQLGDRVVILKIDVDKNPGVARQFGIQGVPTLILFKDGNILWRQSGVVPLSAIVQVLEQYSR